MTTYCPWIAKRASRWTSQSRPRRKPPCKTRRPNSPNASCRSLRNSRTLDRAHPYFRRVLMNKRLLFTGIVLVSGALAVSYFVYREPAKDRPLTEKDLANAAQKLG